MLLIAMFEKYSTYLYGTLMNREFVYSLQFTHEVEEHSSFDELAQIKIVLILFEFTFRLLIG